MDKTQQVADALRKLALNEQAKTYILTHPELLTTAKLVAKRYVAGEKREDAIEATDQINKRGYSATIDFMGESTRSEQEANNALEEFLRLVTASDPPRSKLRGIFSSRASVGLCAG
jgi:proline dehydrogenase